MDRLHDKHGITFDMVPAWFGGKAPSMRPVLYLFEPDPVLSAARAQAWQAAIDRGFTPKQARVFDPEARVPPVMT